METVLHISRGTKVLAVGTPPKQRQPPQSLIATASARHRRKLMFCQLSEVLSLFGPGTVDVSSVDKWPRINFFIVFYMDFAGNHYKSFGGRQHHLNLNRNRKGIDRHQPFFVVVFGGS
ncbi:hypothetical protein GWI33_022616 [Rhynchophorus ferrugineus]|uniref:Uncharacterized protein n=1 Tax=Rhynchophorus ferrugineus TaxID=354439 RepID=A0A834HP33_RHYFE|nr:hypothetical protein GWI33_022616 [Rhynchophorus ferrugineus]